MYIKISIHAPRVGSDHDTTRFRLQDTISLPAPRVGSDIWGVFDV